MNRKRLTQLVLLGSAAMVVGCGYSPRSEFMAIRSQSLAPQTGDGSRLVSADLPTTVRGIGRADRTLADRSGR